MRSVFRCAELREGFRGKLANQQVTFMVLEGGMIAIAVGLLTIWHPGLIFQRTWQHAGWRFRGEKAEERKVVEKSGQRRDEWVTYGHGERGMDTRRERSRQVGHTGYQPRNGVSVTSSRLLVLDATCLLRFEAILFRSGKSRFPS